MAAGQMAEFFATFGFRINQADIVKVDKQLNILEAKARRMSEQSLSNIRVNISRFSFSADFNTRLHRALKARMKVAGGKGIAPEITLRNFVVDRSALLREMKDAIRYVENNTRIRVRTGVNRDGMRGAGGRGGEGGAGVRGGIAAGGAAGAMRGGALPALAGVFGVSKLNQVNQQLIGQERAATAVFQGKEQGQEQLGFVKDLGNRIGFDYRSQADPYLKMAAAGTTAGMSTDGVQGIFTGMAEYSRVMGLSDEDMKGSMRAVEQMLNKGQVYSEELKMQLGEKFPAAIQIMAEAVSGGDTEKLFDMMDDGEVNSLEALPEFARLLMEKARVGGALAESIKDSSAEQGRLANVFNDMVKVFSEAGFEKGQASLFKTMASFFKDMTPLVQAFGEAWKYVGILLRLPLGLLSDLSTLIESLSNSIGMAKGDVLALGAVATLLALPFTRAMTVIGAVLLLLEDFTGYLTGRDSLIGHLLGDDEDLTKSNIFGVFESLFTLLGTVFDRFVDLGQLVGEGLFGSFDTTLNDFLRGTIRLLDDLNVMLGGKTKAQINYESRISSASSPQERNRLLKGKQDQDWFGKNYGSRVYQQVFGGNAGVKKEIDSIMNVNNMPPILKQYAMGTNWLGNKIADFVGATPSDKTSAMRDNFVPGSPIGSTAITQTLNSLGNPDREQGTEAGKEANSLGNLLTKTKSMGANYLGSLLTKTNNMPPIFKQYVMRANYLGNLLTPSEKTNSMRENLDSAQQGNNETSIRDGLTPLKPLTPREDIPPLTQNIYFTGNPDREEVTKGVNDANDIQAQLRQTNDNLGDSG